MRYLLAALAAVLVVAAGWWFVHSTRAGMQVRFEQYKKELKAKRDAGQLPAAFRDVEIDRLQPSQVAFPVPPNEQTRLNIADMLSEYAYILMAVVLAICLAVVVVIDVVRGRKK